MPQVSGRRRAPKRRAGPTPQPGVPRPDPRVRFGSVPLRLFLGATFLYAGIQKLTDSGFLTPSGSTYIGKQLTGYGLRSPIGGLLGWLGQNFSVEVGVLIILVDHDEFRAVPLARRAGKKIYDTRGIWVS